jgi:protease-4
MVSRAPALWLAVVAALAAGCIDLGGLTGVRRPLDETVVFGTRGPKLLLLEVQGPITDHEQPGLIGGGTEGTVQRVREQLQRGAAGDVRGILLRVDSPGGGVAASEVIYRQLRAFKETRGIPIVAHFMGTAASGGYYIAMAADEIRAYPTTVTGSIGVIAVGLNFVGLMEKIGVESQTFTSGDFKDAGSPLRRMRVDEREYMQSIVDDLHARFREVVVAGRPGLGADRVAELADGRVFLASRALEHGLIDGIGDIEESVERLTELAGISGPARVVSYHRPAEWRNNLFTRGPAAPSFQLDLTRMLGPLPSPGFHYLWIPGLR